MDTNESICELYWEEHCINFFGRESISTKCHATPQTVGDAKCIILKDLNMVKLIENQELDFLERIPIPAELKK